MVVSARTTNFTGTSLKTPFFPTDNEGANSVKSKYESSVSSNIAIMISRQRVRGMLSDLVFPCREGFVTRNLMLAPVYSSGKDPSLLGIIQIVNKATENKGAVGRRKSLAQHLVNWRQSIGAGRGEEVKQFFGKSHAHKNKIGTSTPPSRKNHDPPPP